jgi:hypothetical protein
LSGSALTSKTEEGRSHRVSFLINHLRGAREGSGESERDVCSGCVWRHLKAATRQRQGCLYLVDFEEVSSGGTVVGGLKERRTKGEGGRREREREKERKKERKREREERKVGETSVRRRRMKSRMRGGRPFQRSRTVNACAGRAPVASS